MNPNKCRGKFTNEELLLEIKTLLKQKQRELGIGIVLVMNETRK